MNIFEFENYKIYLKNWLKLQPKSGHGQLRQWAEQLNVNSTLLSQILNGEKDFSPELANEFCRIRGFSDNEAEYFLLLVDYSRAGSAGLRARLKRRISAEQKRAETVSQRLQVQTELSDAAKSTFYSNWLYTGIRNLTALAGSQSVEAIAEQLQLPRQMVQEIVEFLLQHGLCISKDGKLQVGPQRTHIPAKSPLVSQHHQNWRQQAYQKMLRKQDEDLFFTFPMSLSAADAKKIRAQLPHIIEDIHKIVGPSESEVVRCLNIDYFSY